MKKPETFYTTVTLSDESYSALLLKISTFFEGLNTDYAVVDSHIVSDRFAKKAYYIAILKKGEPLGESALKSDEENSRD